MTSSRRIALLAAIAFATTECKPHPRATATTPGDASASAPVAPFVWPNPQLSTTLATHLRRVDEDASDGPSYVIDRAVFDAALCDPGTYLGRTKLTAIEQDGGPGGLRVDGDDPSTLLFSLGLRDGDVVKWCGVLPSAPVASTSALLEKLRRGADVDLHFERQGVPMTIALATTGAPSPTFVDEHARIRRVSATEFEIARSLAQDLATWPAKLACSLRVVPDEAGLRLFGVRGPTLQGQLGFLNGDEVQTIAGVPVRNTADAARQIATIADAPNSFEVGISREGKPMKLVYRLAP
jgi:general secretion pathway protein C